MARRDRRRFGIFVFALLSSVLYRKYVYLGHEGGVSISIVSLIALITGYLLGANTAIKIRRMKRLVPLSTIIGRARRPILLSTIAYALFYVFLANTGELVFVTFPTSFVHILAAIVLTEMVVISSGYKPDPVLRGSIRLVGLAAIFYNYSYFLLRLIFVYIRFRYKAKFVWKKVARRRRRRTTVRRGLYALIPLIALLFGVIAGLLPIAIGSAKVVITVYSPLTTALPLPIPTGPHLLLYTNISEMLSDIASAMSSLATIVVWGFGIGLVMHVARMIMGDDEED